MKKLIEITNRITSQVIFSGEYESIQECVEAAIKSGANLSNADLRYANLCYADLSNASLSGANLSNADLSNADLCGCAGNMKEIKSLQFELWPVTYTSTEIQIGCQSHAIEKWAKWNTAAGRVWIQKMDEKALEWAEKWLDIVLSVVEKSPATSIA